MKSAYPHRLPVMIGATVVAFGALALLVPMFLAFALSGNMPKEERDGIWLFMKVWAGFFSAAPVIAWIIWVFSKRAGFVAAIIILAAAAIPFVFLAGLSVVAQLGF